MLIIVTRMGEEGCYPVNYSKMACLPCTGSPWFQVGES